MKTANTRKKTDTKCSFIRIICTFSVLVLLLAGCGKKENPPEEQTTAPILSGVSINGVPLSEFVLLVPRMYYLPEGYAFDGGRAAANMESREIEGKFRCWIIDNPCRMTKVDYVFRANDAR